MSACLSTLPPHFCSQVLSVIATQLLQIRTALLRSATNMTFEGKELRVRPTVGFFITMNPGYAGRTELPDNLKTLFRPVACMIPDYRMIAEVSLYSEGYENAEVFLPLPSSAMFFLQHFFLL